MQTMLVRGWEPGNSKTTTVQGQEAVIKWPLRIKSPRKQNLQNKSPVRGNYLQTQNSAF